MPEWRALYGRVGSRNPFANPDWIAPWLRAFVASGDLRVVTVRARDELRAVAPFYVARTRGKGVLPTMRFELPGTGIHSNLPELPEVLSSNASVDAGNTTARKRWPLSAALTLALILTVAAVGDSL